MIAIVVPRGDDALFGALLFQKYKEFRVYVSDEDPVAADFETRLTLVRGGLKEVEEPLVCVLEAGAVPDKDFLRRVERSTRRHPDFDVYHVNLMEGKPFPRRMSAAKFFQRAVVEQAPAPLSSFVFRTARLRERAVFSSAGILDPLPTVLSCAAARPIRNVWHQRLLWKAPVEAADPVSLEKRIRARIELLRWTERFFGDENYPLGTGSRLALFAETVAQLYPSYSEEALKEVMMGFQVSQGAVRKVRAGMALRSAIKQRDKSLR